MPHGATSPSQSTPTPKPLFGPPQGSHHPKPAGAPAVAPPPAAKPRLSQASFSSRGAEKLCLAFQSAGMCVHKISGSVEMWGGTRSSLLQSQIFYVYGPRPPAFRYVPIVRGSGVSEQGAPLFGGLSCCCISRFGKPFPAVSASHNFSALLHPDDLIANSFTCSSCR